MDEFVPASKHSRPVTVKLGGSLANSPDLPAWIAALDACRLPLVIVPGGGAFAETVRDIQKKMQFDDPAAHHMALLAMQQYGIALAALWPRLVSVATSAAIRRALRLGHVACWNPVNMALEASLPKRWDVTSDTLAAWLASELNADRLILIKSVDVPSAAETTLMDLVAAGLVDPLFPHYAAASGAAVYVAGPASVSGAAALLRQGAAPGHKIRLA